MFLFLIIFIILYYAFLWRRKIYLSLLLPGPFPLPVIGNGMLFINKTSAENLAVIFDLFKKYGPIYRIWAGPELQIVTCDPKDVEVILSNSKFLEKSQDYKYLKPWLNTGLLTSTGTKWMKRRKIITPAFHFSILEENVKCFDYQSNIFVEKLMMFKPKEKITLLPLIKLLTLDVLCESAMGIEIKAQLTNSEYAVALQELITTLTMRFYHHLLRYEIFFKCSKYAKIQEGLLKKLHKFTDTVITERKEKLDKTVMDNNLNNVNEFGIKKKMAFLDILLQSTIDGQPLSNLDIREEVDTFMFEGHDTTTSAILFSLFNIAKYPEVQAKCFQEIVEVIGSDRTTPITLHDLNQLHYIDLVIKETLRLYPSVPIIGRRLNEEETINGKIFPAGANIWMCIICMGRDPNIFPNVDKFIPERFDAEQTNEQMNPYAYIPFSAGQRNCIGQKFAVLELKSTILKVLRYFEISMAEDSMNPLLTSEMILKCTHPLNFYLNPRVY